MEKSWNTVTTTAAIFQLMLNRYKRYWKNL